MQKIQRWISFGPHHDMLHYGLRKYGPQKAQVGSWHPVHRHHCDFDYLGNSSGRLGMLGAKLGQLFMAWLASIIWISSIIAGATVRLLFYRPHLSGNHFGSQCTWLLCWLWAMESWCPNSSWRTRAFRAQESRTRICDLKAKSFQHWYYTSDQNAGLGCHVLGRSRMMGNDQRFAGWQNSYRDYSYVDQLFPKGSNRRQQVIGIVMVIGIGILNFQIHIHEDFVVSRIVITKSHCMTTQMSVAWARTKL